MVVYVFKNFSIFWVIKIYQNYIFTITSYSVLSVKSVVILLHSFLILIICIISPFSKSDWLEVYQFCWLCQRTTLDLLIFLCNIFLLNSIYFCPYLYYFPPLLGLDLIYSSFSFFFFFFRSKLRLLIWSLPSIQT